MTDAAGTAASWTPDELEPAGAQPAGGAAADAAAERAVAEQAAHARGLAAGREEAERAARARLDSAVRAAESAIDALRRAESERAAAMKDDVAALAVAVARHIVGRELESGPEAIMDLVWRALAHFPADQPVRVRVHPADLAALSGAAAPGPAAGSREVRWLADAAIERGGCVVEGRDRVVDGRVDRALERAYRALADD